MVNGGHDLVLSMGQVVPHEALGMANFTKNLFIGVAGRQRAKACCWRCISPQTLQASKIRVHARGLSGLCVCLQARQRLISRITSVPYTALRKLWGDLTILDGGYFRLRSTNSRLRFLPFLR